MPLPLYRKFNPSADTYYVYDTATNHIARVDKTLYDLLDQFCAIKDDETTLPKTAEALDIPSDRQQTAFDEFIEARRKGLFSTTRPEIRNTYSRDAMEEVLEDGVSFISLEVTQQCNLRCRYCTFGGEYEHQRRHGTQMMTSEVARRAARFMIEHSGNYLEVDRKYRLRGHDFIPHNRAVSFYGGEPLLNPEAIRAAVLEASAADPNTRFHISTNFTVFDKKTIEFLIEHKFRIAISLDGPPDVHDRCRVTRDGSPTFTVVQDNLKRFRQLAGDEFFKEHITYNCTLSLPVDLERLNNFFRDEMGVEPGSLNVSSVAEGNTAYLKSFAREQKVAKGADVFLDMAAQPGSEQMYWREPVASILLAGSMGKIRNRAISPKGWCCGAAMHSGPCTPVGAVRPMVVHNGDMYPCERIAQVPLLVVGNIDTGFYKDKIWDLMNQYQSLVAKECSECWALRLCTACYKNGLDLDADTGQERLNPKAALRDCDGIRASVENALNTYCYIHSRNPLVLDMLSSVRKTQLEELSGENSERKEYAG